MCAHLARIEKNEQSLTASLALNTKTLHSAQYDNTKLQNKVAELTAEISAMKWETFTASGGTPTQNTVLLGSSIIRDVSEDKLKSTKVVCKHDGHIKHINEVVNTMSRCSESYDKAILVIGGNDCASPDSKTPSDIVDDYKNLITSTNRVAKSITVSSIRPRLQTETPDMITAVNAGLQAMCQDEGAGIIDNTSSFHLQDGSVNDGYFHRDGIHLTWQTTNKLGENLALNMNDPTDGVCTNRKRNISPPKPGQPDGVDDYVHPFWERARHKAKPRTQSSKIVKTHRNDNQRPAYSSTRSNRSSHDDEMKSTYGSATNNRSSPTNKSSPSNHCYNCYESNHVVRTCKWDEPIQCRRCGEMGHKEKHHHC